MTVGHATADVFYITAFSDYKGFIHFSCFRFTINFLNNECLSCYSSFKRQMAGMNGTVVTEKPHDTYRIAFHNRIRAARQ